jgi:hypothetical protein
MTHTATTASQSQQLLALQRANLIRRARAQLKKRIGAGDLSAAEVILDPPTEARRWPLVELLTSQPGWGNAKCRQFLARNNISEIKPLGELTQRQRQLLAARLSHTGQPRSELVRAVRLTRAHSPSARERHHETPSG